MGNLIPVNQNVTMSSREIAELTGKRHPDVKRDIEKMLADLQVDVSSFAHTHLDVQSRQQIEYLLDREHTECLLTGYSAVHRMKVIRRWHELEKQTTALPQMSELEMIAGIASAAARHEKRITVVEDKIGQIEQGTIPAGYQGYSHLQAT